MSQAKIFEENIFEGGGGSKRIIKGNQGGIRAVGRETKRKLSIKFYGVPTVGVR